MKVMTGIKFCDTAANKGDVSDKPAKNNCWFPKILHHHPPLLNGVRNIIYSNKINSLST
jgi:hypothetical protein